MFNVLLAELPYKIVTLPTKSTLLEAGKVAHKLYFVRSGCIRLWYNADGKDITCQFFFENNAVASVESFINNIPSEYSIETILPSEVYVIDKEDVNTWLNRDAKHKDNITNLFIDRMLSYSKLFLSRITQTPQQRYESLLKEHPEIVAQIPQHYIATYLGISPVSLSRIRSRR